LFLNEDDVHLPTKVEILHEFHQVQDTQHHHSTAAMASLVCKSILGKHFQILLQFQEINRALKKSSLFVTVKESSDYK
jgi:hypothetical protein